MSLRLSGAALTWSVGATTGACIAAFLGPFIPAWGMSIGVPVFAIVFAAMVVRDPRDEWLAGALRLIGAVALGFLVATIPLTLRDADPNGWLVGSWVSTAVAVPIAVVSLWRRSQRARLT